MKLSLFSNVCETYSMNLVVVRGPHGWVLTCGIKGPDSKFEA